MVDTAELLKQYGRIVRERGIVFDEAPAPPALSDAEPDKHIVASNYSTFPHSVTTASIVYNSNTTRWTP